MENLMQMLDERNSMLNSFGVQICAIDAENGFFDVVVTDDDGWHPIIEINKVKEENLGEAINDAHAHFMAWFSEKIKENFGKLGKESQVGLLTELFNSLTWEQKDEFLTENKNDLYRYFTIRGKLIH